MRNHRVICVRIASGSNLTKGDRIMRKSRGLLVLEVQERNREIERNRRRSPKSETDTRIKVPEHEGLQLPKRMRA